MKPVGKQGGFTLVELVIVLALSSLALAGILAGSGVIQRNAEMSSAIDGIRLQIKGVQSQASQAISPRTNGLGGIKNGTSDETFFGKLIEFRAANAPVPHGVYWRQQMHSWTLVESADKTQLVKCGDQAISLPQQYDFINATAGGSTFTSAALVFTNNPLQTFLIPGYYDSVGNGNSPSGIHSGDPGCNPATSTAPTPPVQLSCGTPLNQGTPTVTMNCGAPPQPPLPPDPCNVGGYSCGLWGQYYKTPDLTGAVRSSYIDYQVGTKLDAAGLNSSYPSFKSSLKARAATPASGVSVEWKGEILLGNAPGDGPTTQHTYCFSSNAGSYSQINAPVTYPNGPTKPMTNNFGPAFAPSTYPNNCVTYTGSPAGWVGIDIRFTTTNNSTFARLYEHTSSGDTDVPNNQLRTNTSTSPQTDPPTSFTPGLYGQYFNSTDFTNRIYADTDSVIGDGGSTFSFDKQNATSQPAGAAVTNADTFTPNLKLFNATSASTNKSVKWTGQINVASAGVQRYCIIADDAGTLIIDGQTIALSVVNAPVTAGHEARSCGSTANLTAGWHNIEVDYKNYSSYANVRLESILSNGKYKEVPVSQLQRPMDWSATGNNGSCDPANTSCVSVNDAEGQASRGTWSSSTVTSGSCGTNHLGNITFPTQSGMVPDNTYNLDINYFNEPNGSFPVPSNYSYKVCVTVNGTVLNGGKPISLPISEPSKNSRTYTLTGLTVPNSGDFTVSLDWLNDSYSPVGDAFTCSVFGICPYDANFGISRLDLYRNLQSNGSLTQATPPQSHVAKISASEAQSQLLAARLLGLIVPTAHAAATGCNPNNPNPTDVLDPLNYNSSCFTTQNIDLKFQINGAPGSGTINVNAGDGNIERSINP